MKIGEFILAVLGVIFWVALATALIGGITIAGAKLDLWLLPWQQQQRTSIIHASGGYLQSQAEGISDLYFTYNQTSDVGQKANTTKQICAMWQDMSANGNQNVAYGYLTPSIQSFVSTNCN